VTWAEALRKRAAKVQADKTVVETFLSLVRDDHYIKVFSGNTNDWRKRGSVGQFASWKDGYNVFVLTVKTVFSGMNYTTVTQIEQHNVDAAGMGSQKVFSEARVDSDKKAAKE
jgi:hypothetical protein